MSVSEGLSLGHGLAGRSEAGSAAQVGLAEILVREQRGGLARQHDAAGLQHVAAVGDRERDVCVLLDHGVKIAEGSFEEVATNERVVEAYLGVRGAAEETEAS